MAMNKINVMIRSPRSRALFFRPAPPQTITVQAGETIYPVMLRKNRQARRYTLRIRPGSREAILTMPLRGNLGDAKAFAQRHADWLATRLEKMPCCEPFADGTTIPLRGLAHRIVHRAGERGTVWTETTDAGELLLNVAGAAEHTSRRLQDFLRREARRDLAVAVKNYADALGVRIRRMTIRDQSSRWGSCNSDGALSFSWRLILAPPYVLDYLAAHEVAHLVEMNHSPAFWTVVERVCPHMDHAKAWLAANGNNLHRYGAADR
jgi:predicted metal-dependent hydrolase